jgi:hypothetical protein
MSLSPNVGAVPLPTTPNQRDHDAPGSPSYPSPPRWANTASSQSSPRPNGEYYKSPPPQQAQQALSPGRVQEAHPGGGEDKAEEDEKEEDLDDLFGDDPVEGGAMSGIEEGEGPKRGPSTDSEGEGSNKASPPRQRYAPPSASSP